MAKPTTANVVRLPTAARRKVQQHMNAGARAARKVLREETPWPGEFIFAGEREAMKTAELLADLNPSAELQLLTAICAALDDTARAKVIETLAPGAAAGRRAAKQALAILRTTRMTYGEMNDFDNAWRRLNPNGRA
jgi:hypothetical protein